MNTENYDPGTGLPLRPDYLEAVLPPYLSRSLNAMKLSWAIEDRGERDLHWDCCWCELNADINTAETDGSISHRQADYLRKRYLRMEETE